MTTRAAVILFPDSAHAGMWAWEFPELLSLKFPRPWLQGGSQFPVQLITPADRCAPRLAAHTLSAKQMLTEAREQNEIPESRRKSEEERGAGRRNSSTVRGRRSLKCTARARRRAEQLPSTDPFHPPTKPERETITSPISLMMQEKFRETSLTPSAQLGGGSAVTRV